MSLHALGHAPFRDPAAACRGVPTSIMFPDSDDADATAKARAVCAPCPVRADCLSFAIEQGERWGVWGGLTPVERAEEALRRAGEPTERTCTDCGESKPLGEFRVNRADLLRRQCKPCQNERMRPVAADYRARRRAEREAASA